MTFQKCRIDRLMIPGLREWVLGREGTGCDFLRAKRGSCGNRIALMELS